MTLTRKIILLGLAVAAGVAGTIIYRGNRQIEALEHASATLGQAARRVLTGTQEMDGAVEALKHYLLDVQTREGAPASYDEWSRQQQQARDHVALLRQRLADLDQQAAAPDVAGPGLAVSLTPLRPLVTTLDQRWFAYDEQGSGLTPHSRSYAIGTLLPLVTNELKPAVIALRGLHQSEWSEKIAQAAAREAAARRNRLFAGAGLLLAVVVAALVVAFPTQGAPRYRPRPPAIPLPADLPEPPKAVVRPPPDFRAVGAGLAAGVPKILVVENAPALREMLSLLVATGGYGVVTCETSAEAQAAVRAIPFDLILLDLEMAGTSSLELLFEARRTLPKLKAIFVTDTPDEATAEKLSSHRVAGVLSKRPDPRALLSKISEALTGTPIPFATVYEPDPEDAEKPEEEAPPPVRPEPVVFAKPVPPPAAPPPKPAEPPRPLEIARRSKAPPPPETPLPPPPVYYPEPMPVLAPVPTASVASPEPAIPTEPLAPPAEPPRRAKLKRRVAEPSDETPPA
jgi:CheY-like chemotaxis protein